MKTKEVSYELANAMSIIYEECDKHEKCFECPFFDDNALCYLRKKPYDWEFRFIMKKVGEIGGDTY